MLPVTPIQKFIAGLLLVVFAFGISSKRSWHNLVANHKDGKLSTAVVDHHHKGAGVSKAAFNCQCDDLISESPFVATIATTGIASFDHRPVFFAAIPAAPYAAAVFSLSLRGPPAC